MADNTTIEASMTSLKTSVSEGKALIAAAVTDKGVETAASSSFSTIANNINNIANTPPNHVISFTNNTVVLDSSLSRFEKVEFHVYFDFYWNEGRTWGQAKGIWGVLKAPNNNNNDQLYITEGHYNTDAQNGQTDVRFGSQITVHGYGTNNYGATEIQAGLNVYSSSYDDTTSTLNLSYYYSYSPVIITNAVAYKFNTITQQYI